MQSAKNNHFKTSTLAQWSIGRHTKSLVLFACCSPVMSPVGKISNFLGLAVTKKVRPKRADFTINYSGFKPCFTGILSYFTE